MLLLLSMSPCLGGTFPTLCSSQPYFFSSAVRGSTRHPELEWRPLQEKESQLMPLSLSLLSPHSLLSLLGTGTGTGTGLRK